MKILSFGTVLWDIINDNEYIGGASLNLAAHLAQLGCHSYILSRVGNDQRGKRAIAEIQRYQVDPLWMQYDSEHPTGIAKVILKDDGIPDFDLPENAAYNYIEFTDECKESLSNESFDVFCFGTIEQKGKVTGKSIQDILNIIHAKEVYYDVNIRQKYYTKKIIEDSLAVSTIAKFSEDEVRFVSGLLFNDVLPESKFVEETSKRFSVRIVCVTRGENGCTVYCEGKCSSEPGIKVRVVDTVGSGDAFSAGFLYSYCLNHNPHKSMQAGNLMGAFVASQKGAIPKLDKDILGKLKMLSVNNREEERNESIR